MAGTFITAMSLKRSNFVPGYRRWLSSDATATPTKAEIATKAATTTTISKISGAAIYTLDETDRRLKGAPDDVQPVTLCLIRNAWWSRGESNP